MKKCTLTPKRKPQKSLVFLCLLWITILLLRQTPLSAQCNPDVTPPVAVCVQFLTIQSNVNGPDMTILDALLLDDGSFDDCSPNISIRATLDLNATLPPATEAVQVFGIGDQEVVLWVGDASGNWNRCTTLVTAIPPKCNPDNLAPVCTAPPDLTLTQDYYQSLNLDLQDSLQMISVFGAAYDWDNCSDGNSTVLAAYSVVTYPDATPKTITRSFMAIDDASHTSPVAVQVVNILSGNSMVHIPGWFYPGDTTVDSMEVVSANTELLAVALEDLVFPAACNGEVFKIHRTYTFIDWNTFNPNVPPLVLPALDLDSDGQTGDPYDLVFSGDSLWRVENGLLVAAMAPKVGSYKYVQTIRYNYLDTSTLSINGTVFLDTLTNCSLDSGEPALANWTVKAIGSVSGQVYSGLTDDEGHYNLFICAEDTALEISLDVPFNFSQSCPAVYQLNLLPGQPGVQHIPVHLETNCPLLSVDLSTWRIRPCFSGTYQVSYCNLSDQLVPGVHIEVALDTFINYNSSSIPTTALGGNTYDFQIGDLPPGTCETFNIHFTTSCDAPVGSTHCSEAHIFPDSICAGSSAWSGASLEASAYCDGDSVHLVLHNTGSADMAAPLDFVIIEDFIMYVGTPFLLNEGGEKVVTMPANGATWRIQSPQEINHPWGGTVNAFVEGCGGLNLSGASLAFPVNSSNPFAATDCMVSVSSFDPNDKQATPRGYGIEHYIEKNTDIEYAIRFQNTGTDTAYTIVILDTLSQHLDISSIAPGASSHPFDFDVINGNVLRFRFDSIALPDSAANMVGSQGFVKYHVRQMPDNPDDTYIMNRAAIYFDNNAPVITNMTWHRIGSDFVLVKTDESNAVYGHLNVYPNPSSGEVFFDMPEQVAGGRFVLTDAFGKIVRQAGISGKTYRFERKLLPAGVYFFQIQTAGRGVYSGKVLLK